ncbi:hypothetical protein HW45_05005, partial [Vibrio sp. ER1A]
MKVAICFYGLVGGRADKNGNGIPLDPKIAYNLNYKNIISNNDVDVFIHSWSNEFKDELNKLYNPKRSIIEKQIDFPESDKIIHNRDIKENIKWLISLFKCRKSFIENRISRKKEAFRAYSRW